MTEDTALWIDVVRWFASIGGMLAAVMVAGRMSDRVTGFGFVLFTFASIAWITGGAAEEDYDLMVQNVVLLAINILGVWRWLLAPALLPGRRTPAEG